MGEHPLRRILSRILRSEEDPSSYEITYIHRGAPDDVVRIKASSIKKVGKGSILLSDEETQIPFHRIISVKDEKRQQTLWEKREKSS